jgi:hypothetical protein
MLGLLSGSPRRRAMSVAIWFNLPCADLEASKLSLAKPSISMSFSAAEGGRRSMTSSGMVIASLAPCYVRHRLRAVRTRKERRSMLAG